MDIREHVRLHPTWLISRLVVATKGGKFQRMDDPIEPQIRWLRLLRGMASGPGQPGYQELVGIKARQTRRSTTTEAHYFADMFGSLDPVRTYCVTDADDTTRSLFSKLQTFDARLPPELRSLHNLRFNKNDKTCVSELTQARYDFATAGGKGQGKGWTYQRFVAEEIAFWPGDGEETWASSTATLDTGAPIVFVSTSNGRDTLFWPRAVKARDEAALGSTTTAYDFSPWFEDPGYTEAPPEKWEPLPEDERIRQLYGLTAEQMYWRHNKIHGVRGIGAEKFKKLYPATFEDAFSVDDGGWYDSGYLDEVMAHLPPQMTGPIRIYEPPVPGMTYAAGLDPSWLTGGDDAVLQVRDQYGVKVATMATNRGGPVGLEAWTRRAADLLHRYGDPLTLCEGNPGGGGSVALKILRQEGCRLLQFPSDPNRRGSPMVDFTMSVKTKPEVYNWHRQQVNSDTLELRDHRTIEQLYHIRELVTPAGNTRIEGVGDKDDHADADVLCEWARKHLPAAVHEPRFRNQRLWSRTRGLAPGEAVRQAVVTRGG